MTASKELLERLHAAVGEQLLERILSGEATAEDVVREMLDRPASGPEQDK